MHSIGTAVHLLLAPALVTAVAVAAWPEAPPHTVADRPDPGSPAAVVARHDCWTGAAPADMVGRLPGHVVATVRGRTVYSARLVGPALDQVFGDVDNDLIVHGFCR